jgi:hypothetical protein
MQGSSAPPPCSMPMRVLAPLCSLEWVTGLLHSPPHSLCHPNASLCSLVRAAAMDREWSSMADHQPAPYRSNQPCPFLPGLALLLCAIASVTRSPAGCCRRRAGRWAAYYRGQAAAVAAGRAWPGAGHSWPWQGRLAPSGCPRITSPLESRSPAMSSSRCSAPSP